MKRVAFFCIPAHGHTNPMLPVAEELVKGGNEVRFYSFLEFEQKIRATGADFISCDTYLQQLTQKQEEKMKAVSITEMTIQDLLITRAMNDFLDAEFKSFQPDVVYADSVCFWGKLNAWKHGVPLVVSTSTFAFNQLSSGYMKQSPKELLDLLLGMLRVSKELKGLRTLGYRAKGVLSLVQNDNKTDCVVYTSRQFQPYAESFSEHYAFVGPSVFSKALPDKKKKRPLIYISMGTVINERPDFYSSCIKGLADFDADVIISCGNALQLQTLGELPPNTAVHSHVDQLDVLSRADVFITHCGMNSVSESLYMAVPMVLYPQTGEQRAVARRAMEMGAGVMLREDSPQGIRIAVKKVLEQDEYQKAANSCSADFRTCSGAAGAARFILNAPHASDGGDIVNTLNCAARWLQPLYWAAVIALMLLLGNLAGRWLMWIVGIAAGAGFMPLMKALQRIQYGFLVKRKRKK